MNEAQVRTLEQVRQVLAGTQAMEFRTAAADEGRYAWIESVLRRFEYRRLPRGERGPVLAYLQRLSGYSRAQITRLVSRWDGGKPLVKQYRSPEHAFARRYTAVDVALLVDVDQAMNTLSGPATACVLRRQRDVFGDERFARLGSISVGHLYNLRNSAPYRNQRVLLTKTQPTKSAKIGVRKAPTPEGRPGFIRIDSVHQGDLDGVKGLYHINAVDCVTQWEVVASVQAISEAHLLSVIEQMLTQFPFEILGFHADNGSEYVNHRVAKMLDKLRIEFTRSRPRHSNDNGLAETKNGAIVRKMFGYEHIQKRHAARFDTFCREYLNPFLNYHRPCLFATELADPKKPGRIKSLVQRGVSLEPWACEAASVPVAWQLYLPKEWAHDLVRRDKTGVPEALEFAAKPKIALQQIEHLMSQGAPAHCVLADAGYGVDTAFPEGLTDLGLRYVVGVTGSVTVWPPGREPLPPPTYRGHGRVAKNLRLGGAALPQHHPQSIRALAFELGTQHWHTVTWREGTNASLRSRFARVRVRAAHRDHLRDAVRAPEWLLIAFLIGITPWAPGSYLVGQDCHEGPEPVLCKIRRPPNADARSDSVSAALPAIAIRRRQVEFTPSPCEMTDLSVPITEFPPYSDTGRCFERASIELDDGTPLTVYCTEPGRSLPRVVVSSSLGFPAAFVEPFALRAAGRLQVITWDQRCMPGPGVQDFASIGPSTHAGDLQRVFDHFAVSEASLLGYCNGSEVALLASVALAGRVKRVVMTNAHYSFRKQRQHASTHGLFTILSDIARHPTKAPRYYEVLRLMASSEQPVPSSISKYPFAYGADKLHRLAVMIDNYKRSDIEAWISSVTAPCVSFIAEDDDISDPEQSIQVVDLLSRCEGVRVPHADHYSLYSDPAYQEQVLATLLAP